MKTKNTKLPSLDEIFEQYTIPKGINTWEEVAQLGSLNIEELIKSLKSHENALNYFIKKLYQKVNFLRGKNGKDFQELAKKYENPKNIEVGRIKDSLLDDEPIDEESQNRGFGATTFNICGWCKYAKDGRQKYDYYITTGCSLIAYTPKTKFNTPCLLHGKTYEDIQREVELLQKEINAVKVFRQKVRLGIKHLSSLKETSIEKPYLISLRPYNHFNIGDEIMICVKTSKEQEDWIPGIVVWGNLSQDGHISYQTNFMHSDTPNLDGIRGYAGSSSPTVLLKKEFLALREAFKSDNPFYNLWIKNLSSYPESFDLETFKSKLISGSVAE